MPSFACLPAGLLRLTSLTDSNERTYVNDCNKNAICVKYEDWREYSQLPENPIRTRNACRAGTDVAHLLPSCQTMVFVKGDRGLARDGRKFPSIVR